MKPNPADSNPILPKMPADKPRNNHRLKRALDDQSAIKGAFNAWTVTQWNS